MKHQEIREEIKHIIDNYELDFDTLRDIVHNLREQVDLSTIRHQYEMRDKRYSPIWDKELTQEKKKDILDKTGLAGYITDLDRKWETLREIEKRKICIQLKSENIEPDSEAYLARGPFHAPRCVKCWHNDSDYNVLSNPPHKDGIKLKCVHCGALSEKD